MIDKIISRISRILELTLALAFILAVLLNFTNVVGRYAFGISLMAADELQIFIMIAMTFIGAAVVTQRKQHLRMDVLAQLMPSSLRAILDIAELLLLIALSGFIFFVSYSYAARMMSIMRTSDMANVPMWIPHGSVALGFGLIVAVGSWRLVRRLWSALKPELGKEVAP